MRYKNFNILWGSLRLPFIAFMLSFALCLFVQFQSTASCFTRSSSPPARRRLMQNSFNVDNHQTIQSNSSKSEEKDLSKVHEEAEPKPVLKPVDQSIKNNVKPATSAAPPLLAGIIMAAVKFLVKNILAKEWNADLAIKRLDDLKTSLVTYYASRNLFQGFPTITAVSTARDKGIGFPSLEGALLSLAFLTFSVFLIDMIQTLLAKLKLKTALAATVSPVLQMGRHFHESKDEDDDWPYSDVITTLSSKVLSAIEKPLF